MDTGSDKTAGSERGASIRLRYSRQFQSGGQAHTIDAEALLPVGASQERRDQVIRELETGVEQLARQIVQRATRSGAEGRSQAQTSVRPPATTSGPVTLATNRAAEPARFQGDAAGSTMQRQPTNAPLPDSHAPASENTPASPASGAERTIRLADFITLINKRWNMSPKEAMDLLNVKGLDGLNYREALFALKDIKEPKNADGPERSRVPSRTTEQKPAVEAPRQESRGASPQSTSQSPGNQATTAAPGTRPQAVRQDTTKPLPLSHASAGADREPQRPERDLSGPSKAPIPIQIGVVRDISPRTYKFEEEEDEEALELPEDEDVRRRGAQIKLDELKAVRGNSVASPGRLTVLNNVIGEQISEEQLLKVMLAVWGANAKKRLKTDQAEALISWAKEDSFAEEAEALLARIEEGEN